MSKRVTKNLHQSDEWESWVRDMLLPPNVGAICCYCGRTGEDLVDYLKKTTSDFTTYTFDLREVLKANDKILIPIEPPWISSGGGELLLVIEPIVACFGCIEIRLPRLDIRSIGDRFVEKM